MAGFIPETILEDILSRIDIVEVISEYMPLKHAGRNFRALCPFHHEKSPSFMVSSDRQIYHCFGCGAGGNAFNFLMQHQRLEFPEAVEILARKAGISLPQTAGNNGSSGVITQIYKINQLTAEFFAQNLLTVPGARAKSYLAKRGITDETIKSFKLGYSLDRWDGLLNYLRTKNITLSQIEKAGLILPKEGGGYYDRFRNRLMIPIYDAKSNIVGFGARVLPDSIRPGEDKHTAKYVNSPETAAYTKRSHLYGLNFAKDPVRETDFLVIVEGYLDFLIPYQAGIHNIAASLGTAFTGEQARLIKRHTQNVVMVYDGDAAGEMAAVRSLDIFVEEGMDVKIAVLPQGFDPDTFVREKGADQFKQIIYNALSLFDYKMKVLKSKYGVSSIESKAKISAEMLSTIHKFTNAIIKTEYIKKLAHELSISDDSLVQELKKLKPEKSAAADQTPNRKKAVIHPTEKLLLKLMLEESRLINTVRERIEPSDFQDERTSRIVSLMFNLAEEGKQVEPRYLISQTGDEEACRLICDSTFLPELSENEKESVVDDCIKRLKINRLHLQKQLIH
ncbi:MAG: DNA primase, partial [Candidatus Omnitrophica bacterium]|nr:DNA primase [Candidatus Omnitrophota bacterium]